MNPVNRELTPSEVQDYNRLSGLYCPHCDSSDVRCDHPISDGELVYRDNECMSCESLWVEYFTVSEITLTTG